MAPPAGPTRRAAAARGRRRAAYAALAVLLGLLGGSLDRLGAQIALPTPESYLRVDWAVDASSGGRPRLSGYVYNDRNVWAVNVTLSIEVLDAAGQAVASALAPVYGEIPSGGRSYFEARVPAAGSRYRVTVRSVDFRGYGAGGG